MVCTTTNSIQIQTLAYSTVTKPPQQEAEGLPVLREEAEEALRYLKEGKSPGVDNIPSKLLKNRGEARITVLAAIRQKILEMKEWIKEWTQLFIIPLPKKVSLKQS